MSDLTIRTAAAGDLTSLVAFNQAMAWETEQKTLNNQTLSAGVQGILQNPHRGFYLVAEQQSQIAGSLMVTYEWSDWRNGNFWWVQSVYILPEFRRQGIYRALYQRVQALGQAEGNVCGYRLYVEKDNVAAQRTYQSLEMAECQYYMYQSQ